MPKGDELLIADSVERDREGLRKLFDGEGYVCTAIKTPEEARQYVQRKFFPAAVIDLDFGELNGGLELTRFIRDTSSATKVVLLTSRRTFEAAVTAMRLGVVDIIAKRPDQISTLSGVVRGAVDRSAAGDKDSALLQEVRSVLEEAFKIMMALSRKIHGDESSSSIATPLMKPMILIVDEDQAFLKDVAELVIEKDWEVSVELSGGAGLDKASTFAFQIVAVCQELSDLPGQMVIKSVQSQQNKPLGLVYSKAGEGSIEKYEDGQPTDSEQQFKGASHLVERLEQLAESVATMRRERRHLQAFRSEYGEYLKRYAELKVRIDSLSK
jgi:DNA-binding response OmpR family regulator